MASDVAFNRKCEIPKHLEYVAVLDLLTLLARVLGMAWPHSVEYLYMVGVLSLLALLACPTTSTSSTSSRARTSQALSDRPRKSLTWRATCTGIRSPGASALVIEDLQHDIRETRL